MFALRLLFTVIAVSTALSGCGGSSSGEVTSLPLQPPVDDTSHTCISDHLDPSLFDYEDARPDAASIQTIMGVEFYDARIANCVGNTITENGYTSLSDIETFSCGGINERGSLKGIEALENLQELRVSGFILDGMDLSQNRHLETIVLNGPIGDFTTWPSPVLNLGQLQELKSVEINGIATGNINFCGLNLDSLSLSYNELRSFDFDQIQRISSLSVKNNPDLELVNLPSSLAIHTLSLGHLNSEHIDLQNLHTLTALELESLENLKSVNTSEQANIESLSFALLTPVEGVFNELQRQSVNTLEVYAVNLGESNVLEDFPNLENLSVSAIDQLTYLDLSNWNNLEQLTISTVIFGGFSSTESSMLKKLSIFDSGDFLQGTLDLSELSNLEEIESSGFEEVKLPVSSQVTKLSLAGLNTIDLTKQLLLRELYLHRSEFDSIDLASQVALEELHFWDNRTAMALDVRPLTKLKNFFKNQVREGASSSEYSSPLLGVTFGDHPMLESVIIEGLDDGNYEVTSLQSVPIIDMSGAPNLKEFRVSAFNWTSRFSGFIFNQNTKLEFLTLDLTRLEFLDTSSLVSLKELNLTNNNLTYIDLGNSTQLEQFTAPFNLLESVDLSMNQNLRRLDLRSNLITNIDLQFNPNLELVLLHDNPLNSETVIYLQELSSQLGFEFYM